VAESAGVLRAALALRSNARTEDLFGARTHGNPAHGQ